MINCYFVVCSCKYFEGVKKDELFYYTYLSNAGVGILF